MDLQIARQIFNFLMIAGIILGISFVLTTSFSKRGRHKSVIYLVLVILFLTLNNIQIVLVESRLFEVNFYLRKLLIPWYLLIFPSFYTFLTYYLKIEQKIYSFVPITVGLFLLEIGFRIGFIPFYSNDNNNFIVAKYSQIEEIVNAVFAVFLYAKAFLLLFRYANLYQYVLSYDNVRWLKIFMALGSLVILLWLTAIISNISEVLNPEIYIYYPMRLSCSIILYWIGYQGFFNYNILTQRIQIREDIASQVKTVAEKPIFEPVIKVPKTEISTEIESKDYQFMIIKNHIENNNRYLDSMFSLEILASETNMSSSKVSSIINNHSEFNFSDYINQFRIEKAKTLLLEPKYNDYNIESIGFECGFNSKSAFYTAFKKFTNLTPTEFKKKID
jgi:AraC-like DNA-binding protein